ERCGNTCKFPGTVPSNRGHCSAYFFSGDVLAVRQLCITEVESCRVKSEGIGQMRGKVGPIVSARVEVKFMTDAAGGEQIMERLSACLNSIIVLGAAVKIDFHPGEACRARDRERIGRVRE